MCNDKYFGIFLDAKTFWTFLAGIGLWIGHKLRNVRILHLSVCLRKGASGASVGGVKCLYEHDFPCPIVMCWGGEIYLNVTDSGGNETFHVQSVSSHPVRAPMLAQHFQARPSRARSASVKTGFIHERKHFIESMYLNTHIHCCIPHVPTDVLVWSIHGRSRPLPYPWKFYRFYEEMDMFANYKW